ncbi:MAG TPA: carotenoid biosynthesis protein [Bacteroidales bacterium]|nr:carotenoid biosynthesis protein [Bacteroidales bacterium]
MKFQPGERKFKYFVVSFYIVGLAGLLTPRTSHFFIELIPYTLLFNFFLLLYFHREKANFKTLIVFSTILFLGLAIEMVGVNTGIIFGRYEYGGSLGTKVYNTPVIIGMNWLLLTYLAASIFETIRASVYIKILLASTVMLIYDVVLEQVAPRLGMWTWQDNIVPLQNYVTWFVLAAGFQILIKVFKVRTVNPLSGVILWAQFLFFVVLFLFLR